MSRAGMDTTKNRHWMPIDVWFVAVGEAEMTDHYRLDPRFHAYRQLMRWERLGADRDEDDEKGTRPMPGIRTSHANQCRVDGGSGLPPGVCGKCSAGSTARAQYESLLERIDKRAR